MIKRTVAVFHRPGSTILDLCGNFFWFELHGIAITGKPKLVCICLLSGGAAYYQTDTIKNFFKINHAIKARKRS